MKKDSRKLPLTDEQIRESDLLNALFKEKKAALKLTQEKIAAELGEGVTQGAVSHFLNRRTALNVKAATVFAKMLQVPIEAFSKRLADEMESLAAALPRGSRLYHEASAANTPLPVGGDVADDNDERYAFIPQYDAKAAAGLGHENPHVEPRSTLAFKREWLRFKGVSPKNLIVIYADGDSMWPTINDRDVLLLDMSKVDPVDGRLFVLHSVDKGLIVKRLVKSPFSWIVRSDNPDKNEYPDVSLPKGDTNELRIRGQVIWRGGDL